IDMRRFDRDFALTNRLRTEGTDNLLAAAKAAGVGRFVAQGIAAFGAYARVGGPIRSEDDPLEPNPAREMRETIAAIRYLEDAVLGADWVDSIVLRYGTFYGPGTSLAPGGGCYEISDKRKRPIVGDGGGGCGFLRGAEPAGGRRRGTRRGRR